MDSLKNLAKNKRFPSKRNPKLHSPNHLLADELATKLGDHSHFGFYLKMASTIPHPVLQRLAGEVLENPKVENPGKLFAYLIKKYNQTQQKT
ncbi:MAG TPA: hypothetical protein PKD79_03265 [Candidatus Doudnabacteria bacterium]|nr:hypothetical protein [Candidatus Doudnabacteria bacterium]